VSGAAEGRPRKRVFVMPGGTAMHRGVEKVLAAAGDVEIVHGQDERELDAALPGLAAIYAAGPRRIDRATIAAAPRLEVVFVRGSGFEDVDVEAATEHGVACVNSAGVNAAPVADEAIGLMLALSLQIAYVDRSMHREGRWISFADLGASGHHPRMLTGKTMGIVGFGFVGRELARRCVDGFRMRVLVFDPFFDPAEAERLGVEPVEGLEELLPQVDFLSLNVPLTPATEGLIGEEELRAMKPGAILVNTGRGATLDTAALVRALRDGHLGGAGLDVVEPEPLPDGHPLFGLDNVVLSPHISGGADDAMEELGVASATQALRVLRGLPSHRVLNPEVLPRLAERRRLGERVVLVTGATDGLGRAVAERLAAAGLTVHLHGRDPEKLDRAVREIAAATGNERLVTHRADLASLAQVRSLARGVEESTGALHVLVSNAGIGSSKPDLPTRQLSEDGYELRFAVNYLAGFLLILELLPLLRRSAPARVVQIASRSQVPLDFDNLELEREYDGIRAYSQAKLAQIASGFELAERLGPDAGVSVNSLHPASLMPTKIALGEVDYSEETVEDGVEATVRMAIGADVEGVTGAYYHRMEPARAHEQAYDAAARRRLWDLSVAMTGAPETIHPGDA
jgi:phosphoglycerate dehydrogenase-like enzyme/NAD(P)-dependent dehydrogenase (short-subunit alcohol dehydrogenase family)